MMADLLFEVKNHIATITLNRAESLNAFSEEMILSWIKALEEVRDNDDIRAVILKGNGKAFCAGGDIKAMVAGKGFYHSEEDITSTALARKNSLWKKCSASLCCLKKSISRLLRKCTVLQWVQDLIWH